MVSKSYLMFMSKGKYLLVFNVMLQFVVTYVLKSVACAQVVGYMTTIVCVVSVSTDSTETNLFLFDHSMHYI